MTRLLAALERHINRRTRRYIQNHHRLPDTTGRAAITTRKVKP